MDDKEVARAQALIATAQQPIDLTQFASREDALLVARYLFGETGGEDALALAYGEFESDLQVTSNT